MSGEDALLLLADRLADLDDSLEQAGFTACLVDRDWMRSHANAEEWGDFLLYKREYAREAMLSSNPAGIEHSNPGEYQWRSADIAAREQVPRQTQEVFMPPPSDATGRSPPSAPVPPPPK